METDGVTHLIKDARSATSADRALLVGISGIDASGKGHIARTLAGDLEDAGYHVALINVDGWLNLPKVRFAKANAGDHFYKHALRLDEMFEHLILPLKENREINLAMNFAEETATKFRKHTYNSQGIDIIMLEGIFIFKREFARHFDLKIWIECSFETALARAVERGQENLPHDATVAAYQNIYFPAQRLHFELDRPSETVELIWPNE